jgi:hypothetical protein
VRLADHLGQFSAVHTQAIRHYRHGRQWPLASLSFWHLTSFATAVFPPAAMSIDLNLDLLPYLHPADPILPLALP